MSTAGRGRGDVLRGVGRPRTRRDGCPRAGGAGGGKGAAGRPRGSPGAAGYRLGTGLLRAQLSAGSWRVSSPGWWDGWAPTCRQHPSTAVRSVGKAGAPAGESQRLNLC